MYYISMVHACIKAPLHNIDIYNPRRKSGPTRCYRFACSFVCFIVSLFVTCFQQSKQWIIISGRLPIIIDRQLSPSGTTIPQVNSINTLKTTPNETLILKTFPIKLVERLVSSTRRCGWYFNGQSLSGSCELSHILCFK